MGYIGQKMSERAMEAYENGEMPLSKWTKSVILENIETEKKGESEKLKKYSAETLRDYFLILSSWHHTAKYFNRTNFYEFYMPERISYEKLDELEKQNKDEKKRKKNRENEMTIALVKYGEWEGTRRHPKLAEYKELAIIKGNVAYFSDGRTKRTTGKHFEVIETYSRCPYGHADEINKIRKKLKRTQKSKK